MRLESSVSLEYEFRRSPVRKNRNPDAYERLLLDVIPLQPALV